MKNRSDGNGKADDGIRKGLRSRQSKGNHRLHLIVELPVAESAMGSSSQRAFVVVRVSGRGLTVCLVGVRNYDPGGFRAVRMREHAERAEKHVQQRDEGGLRASRFAVFHETLAQGHIGIIAHFLRGAKRISRRVAQV